MPVETETLSSRDAAKVSPETTEQVASEIDKPDDSVDTSKTEDDAQSEDISFCDAEHGQARKPRVSALWRQIKWSRVLAFGVLPVLALFIASAAGFLKWQDAWVRGSRVAAIDSVATAKESTVALLSYQPGSVEKDLDAARTRLTGKFEGSYTQLVHDIVIPGAKKDHIAAVATVPAAVSVSATPNHAVVLVFVSQTVTVGNDAPTDTASTVRVTLDKIGGRWLISQFDPV